LWFLCWNSQRSCFWYCDLAAAKIRWEVENSWAPHLNAFSSIIKSELMILQSRAST
jgi:hypothetical protein